ncbi:heparan-alpha-glucosaminide N-acetyltransferase [Thermincola ferriacetica]
MLNRDERKRIWELDFLRGIALILMIIFHFLYDLNEFFHYPVAYYTGVYYYIGKVSVILFMLISGISSSLSRNNLKRGLRLLIIAMGITAVTHLWQAKWGIKFGILHFLGVSIMLYPALARLPSIALPVLGTLVIWAGRFLPEVSFDYLFPLGIKSSNFVSGDYYPLIPWLGVFVYGVFLGKVLYKNHKSLLKFRFSPQNPVNYLGAHTLLIYLIHQPLLLFMLNIIFHFS